MRRPGSGLQMHAPFFLEQRARRVVRDMAVARQLVRERAHIARALHVVLAAQRIHADAAPADIAGRHGEIGHRHHRRGALAVLGHAEAVIDRGIAAGRVKPRRGADRLRRHAGIVRGRFGAVLRPADERFPIGESIGLATLAHEALVGTAFGDDDMRQRVEDRDIGARPQRQMIIGFDMCRAHEIGAARIDDDQLRPAAQPLLHARGEHRMRVGRIGADHDDDVGLIDRIEILRARRGAEGLAEAVAGRRMADARAGVGVVVAEHRAGQLLHQIGFLVGAARRCDDADRILAGFGLQPLELAGDAADGVFP